MANSENYRGQEEENWRMGRKLYEQDKQQQQRYGYRGNSSHNDKQWDEGNYFHTGPSKRGAQDSTEKRYGESYHHDRNRTYAQERNAHLSDHYGSKSDSPYRNERSYLNHGQGYQHSDMHNMRRPHTPGGSLQGNTSDVNNYPNDMWRDSPDSRSRYKQTDYRYGSGSHNWYREGRYTPDSNETAPYPRDNRSFVDRVKDTWNDIWHSDDPEYQPRNPQSQSERLDSRTRYGSEEYRDRRFDRGYEGGPRWADETDSGSDDYYNNIDETKRYRR